MHVHSGEDLDKRKQIQVDLVNEFKTNPDLDRYISVDLALYDRAMELFIKQREVLASMRQEVLAQVCVCVCVCVCTMTRQRGSVDVDIPHE